MPLDHSFPRRLSALALLLACSLPLARAQGMLRPLVYTPMGANISLLRTPEIGCKAQIAYYAAQPNSGIPANASVAIFTFANGVVTNGALPYNTPQLGGWKCKASFFDIFGRPQLAELNWMYPVCPDSWSPGSYNTGTRYCDRQPVLSCEQVSCKEDSPFTRNPFHVLSGTRRIEEDIYSGGREGRLKFSITYRNMSYLDMSGTWYPRPFRSVRAEGPLSTADYVHVERGDGLSYPFELRGDAWVGAPNYAVSFRRAAADPAAGAPARWEFVDRDDTVDSFDADGRLLASTWRDGYRQRTTYAGAEGVYPADAPACAAGTAAAPGQLQCLTDSHGRQLNFEYNAAGKLVTMRDPAGAAYTFSYDARGMLTAITWPGGFRKNYLYDEAGLAPPGRNLLTGILEADGDTAKRYATYGYDGGGKATSSVRAGEGDGYRIINPSNAATTLLDPRGARRIIFFAFINGLPQVTNDIQTLAGGATVGTVGVGYDGNGNPAQRTDLNGIRSTTSQDLRGRELQRIEAAGTPQERRFTTEWHASYRLPLRIAGPLRITSFTYDASGNVLSRREQATTDASGRLGFDAVPDGAPREWRFTYSSDGLPISEQDPAGALTRHEYDSQGNLVASVNALGHRSEFLDYDANGRAHRIVDANGAVQRLDYHARGWLLARDVEGEVTRYEYTGSGLLRSLRLPDGGGLDFTYDDGHRMLSMSDTLGNRVAYRLDVSGNRVAEEVFDAQGTLRRRITRVYDDLGRLVESVGQ